MTVQAGADLVWEARGGRRGKGWGRPDVDSEMGPKQEAVCSSTYGENVVVVLQSLS